MGIAERGVLGSDMRELQPTLWNRPPATVSRTTVVAMFYGSIALGLAFGPTRARPPAAAPGLQKGATHDCIVNHDMRAGQAPVARPAAIATAHGCWSMTESA
jgi:hypothetical protein